VALIKKKMESKGVDLSHLIVCHCIIHQEHLCENILGFEHIITTAVSSVNLIKSNNLNHCPFQQLLADIQSEYDDVKCFCDLHWLSKADMLRHAYNLLNEIKLFLAINNRIIVEFDDEEWNSNFAFLVDIMQHMNDLQLQGRRKHTGSLFSFVKSFQTKLRLWMSQMRNCNVLHFLTLKSCKILKSNAQSMQTK
jgi:hypothetical protein